MPDTWKVTPARDASGRGRAIVVDVARLGGGPVSLEALGQRFGLQPDRLLAALLHDERNRLAAANLHMTGETTAQPSWTPKPSAAEVAKAIAWRRQRAVQVERDAWGYLQLAKPGFTAWQVLPEATIYVPLHEKLAPRVDGDGLVSLAKRVVVIEAAAERLKAVLDELSFLTDRAAKASRAEADYLLRVRRELAVLTWMDWVAWAMLQESKENRRSHTDAQVERTRRARQRLREYRRQLERHLLDHPHRVIGEQFPSGEGVLGGAARRLLDALTAEPTVELLADIARTPEQVPFELWWRLQSALFRASNVLADAWGPVRKAAYERLVAPALGVLVRRWREGKTDLQPLDAKRPGLAAAVRAPWPADKLGGETPAGAVAKVLDGVSGWMGLAKNVGGLGLEAAKLAERWSQEMVDRLAADPRDRETLVGVLYKLAVETDDDDAWRRELAQALTIKDDHDRMERLLERGSKANAWLSAVMSLAAVTSYVLSLSGDSELTFDKLLDGFSAVVDAGSAIEDLLVVLKKVDDADLIGFGTAARFTGALGLVSSVIKAKGVYDAGDVTGGHLALTKSALAAAGMLASGPLSAVLIAADLAISYVEWNREINRGGAVRAFLALLDRLEKPPAEAKTLTARLLEVPKLLDDHPYELVNVSQELRTLYYDAAWWDLTDDAGRTLLRGRVPYWVVKLAVGRTPWPEGEPSYTNGEAVLALDLDTWKKTTVVRAVPNHTSWRYELKLRDAAWDEDRVAPYFPEGTRLRVRDKDVPLAPLAKAKVRKVDLPGGRYDLEPLSDGAPSSVPFTEARARLSRA